MSHQTLENRNWKIIFSLLFANVGCTLFGTIVVIISLTQARLLVKLVMGFVVFSVCMLPVGGLYILLVHSPYGLSKIRRRSGEWFTRWLRLYLGCIAIINALGLMLSIGVIILSGPLMNFQETIKELLEFDVLWIIFGGGALVHILGIIWTYIYRDKSPS